LHYAFNWVGIHLQHVAGEHDITSGKHVFTAESSWWTRTTARQLPASKGRSRCTRMTRPSVAVTSSPSEVPSARSARASALVATGVGRHSRLHGAIPLHGRHHRQGRRRRLGSEVRGPRGASPRLVHQGLNLGRSAAKAAACRSAARPQRTERQNAALAQARQNRRSAGLPVGATWCRLNSRDDVRGSGRMRQCLVMAAGQCASRDGRPLCLVCRSRGGSRLRPAVSDVTPLPRCPSLTNGSRGPMIDQSTLKGSGSLSGRLAALGSAPSEERNPTDPRERGRRET
jgi:hypothetical protein